MAKFVIYKNQENQILIGKKSKEIEMRKWLVDNRVFKDHEEMDNEFLSERTEVESDFIFVGIRLSPDITGEKISGETVIPQ